MMVGQTIAPRGGRKRAAEVAHERICAAAGFFVGCRTCQDFTCGNKPEGLPQARDRLAAPAICAACRPIQHTSRTSSGRDLPELPVGLRTCAQGIGHAAPPINSCQGMPVSFCSLRAFAGVVPLIPRLIREIWERDGAPFTNSASSVSVLPCFSTQR